MRQPPWILLALLLALGVVLGLPAFACAADPANVSDLQDAMDELDAWIGPAAKGDRWRTYLHSETLRQQMALGAEADLAATVEVLQQYQSGIAGLEMRRFAAVRRELELWLGALIEGSSQDLPSLVWALRGEHRPMSNERFAPIRQELRDRAEDLQRAIGRSNTAERWNEYLKWDLLEPHFQDDVAINRKSLQDLDSVLRRFHTNQPGLEMPVFLQTARALEHYRALAFWNALSRNRDTGPIYDAYLKGLQEQLRRHQEDSTVETTRKIGKSLGMIEHQGQSPWLLEVLRARHSRPNVVAEVSVAALNNLAEPISQSLPVRDCVLGARVRGTAMTDGEVTLAAAESPDHISLDIQLAGHITTNTVGFKKPVQVRTTGHTNYSATKTLFINDERFHASPTQVSAKARNHIRSVKKTGGDFGRKLIEKIAWKQVRKKKAKTERITEGKARRRISQQFDERVITALTRGRVQYDEKLRLPMLRRGLVPENMHFASTAGALLAQMSLATGSQLSADADPPPTDIQNDVTVQVHETAVNNFLPYVLAGVGMKQDSADQPAQLEGEVPPWLKKLAEKNKELEISGPTKDDPQQADIPEEEFKPFELVFNSEHPASVSFDNNRLSVRLRFAVLKAGLDDEEKPLANWDFLMTFQVSQRGKSIVLTRVGQIEVFPTGFDPRWDTKLSGEQVSYRNNMAKNINRKAARGEGIPAEIVIPELKLPEDSAIQRSFELQQLECDNGWLTVGYRLL